VKKIIILLLVNICWDSKIWAQCKRTAIVHSTIVGYAKSGVVLGMEAGVWPIMGKIGAMAGILMYDQKFINIKGEGESYINFDVIGRLIYKLSRTGSDNPQAFTVYGSLRGMYGASYRAYRSLGDYSLLGIEPCYSNKTGPGINFLFTTRLN